MTAVAQIEENKDEQTGEIGFMEYAIAAGGLELSDIFQKMSANPWLLVIIAVVAIVAYLVTTRA